MTIKNTIKMQYRILYNSIKIILKFFENNSVKDMTRTNNMLNNSIKYWKILQKDPIKRFCKEFSKKKYYKECYKEYGKMLSIKNSLKHTVIHFPRYINWDIIRILYPLHKPPGPFNFYLYWMLDADWSEGDW